MRTGASSNTGAHCHAAKKKQNDDNNISGATHNYQPQTEASHSSKLMNWFILLHWMAPSCHRLTSHCLLKTAVKDVAGIRGRDLNTLIVLHRGTTGDECNITHTKYKP